MYQHTQRMEEPPTPKDCSCTYEWETTTMNPWSNMRGRRFRLPSVGCKATHDDERDTVVDVLPAWSKHP